MARKDSEKPKEIIQSYLVTSAKYDFNVYEKRILYRIVELIQSELKGYPIGKGITIEPTLYGDRKITMPISRFLKDSEEDKNHYHVKKAFKRLKSIVLEESNKEYWTVYSIVEKPEIRTGSSYVTFELDKHLYTDLLTFAKGYSQYELQVAFNFRSQYTMRLYEMISRCSRPAITYSIDNLREMFMLKHKYSDTNRFISKVIDPAQKELRDSKSPYWFTYEKIKEGRAFKNIQFNVHYRPEYDKKLSKQTSIRWEVEKWFLDLLNESLSTDNKTWQPHRTILMKVQGSDYNEIKKILKRAQKAKNPVGYTVNAFKKMNIVCTFYIAIQFSCSFVDHRLVEIFWMYMSSF